MKRFNAVIARLEDTRKIYENRSKVTNNDRVKAFLEQRESEFALAISILNEATVNERTEEFCKCGILQTISLDPICDICGKRKC